MLLKALFWLIVKKLSLEKVASLEQTNIKAVGTKNNGILKITSKPLLKNFA